MKIVSRIISQLPNDEIRSARLVHKTWQTAVDSSFFIVNSQRWFVPDRKPQGRPIYAYVSYDVAFTGHFEPPGEDRSIEEEDYPEC